MLKHVLAVIAVATAAMLALAPATVRAAANDDAPGSHWYFGVGAGSATSSSITTTTYAYPYAGSDTFSSSGTGGALRVFGGWRMLNRRGDAFGIGLSDTGVSLGDSTSAGILALDLNAKMHLAGAWFISGRVGAYSGRKFVYYSNDYYSNDYYSYSSAQDGTFYGFGTGIDINASNALAVTWDRYQISDFTDNSVDPPSRISDAHLDVYLLTYTYTF